MRGEKIQLGCVIFVFRGKNWIAVDMLLTVVAAAGSLSIWDYLATEKGSC